MTHHRRGLRRLLRDDDLADAVEADWRSAPISDQRRAMLEYAIQLTTSPGEVTEADVDALRKFGFSDHDILDIVEVTAYYAYANRIADGLGITTEPWIPDES
ncbi:MAG: peroxidase-related enzyme [Acidimicrobiales bacterium]|nr:peroxidase-related enzyme [Acidimicrobiales bacterium]